MLASLIAAVAAAAAGGADVGGRIGEAARAEAALRGPLEGAWTLRDAGGRPLMDLQIADPLDGRLGGAWRELGPGGASGVIDGGSRGGRVIQLRLAGEGERAWLILRAEATGRWQGRLIAGGRPTPVTLGR